jgi:TonB family protein
MFERRASGAPPSPAEPLRAGGEIPIPKQIKHVEPVYPPFAVSTRIQGLLIIEVTIAPNGKVMDTKVLTSPSMILKGPAVEAVKQWEYEPTVWRGVAVPIIMSVTVTFKLS